VTYHPVIATVAAQPIAAVTARLRPEHLSHVVFNALDSVHAALRAGDYGPYWGDVVLCEGENDGVLDLRIGVGVARPFPGLGAVSPWTTPGGEALQVAHLGPWSERGLAHDAARDRAAQLGRRLTGVCWEVYGAFDLPTRSRRTDVFYEAEADA
jgi:effector-binding domain-containing protein